LPLLQAVIDFWSLIKFFKDGKSCSFTLLDIDNEKLDDFNFILAFPHFLILGEF